MKKTGKLEKIKLNKLSEKELNRRAMNVLRGGSSALDCGTCHGFDYWKSTY